MINLFITSVLDEGFKKRISDLKAKGNAAHRNKDHHLAIFFYETAINIIDASRYDMRRDKAVLYSNMAAEHARVGNDDSAFDMAEKSRNADPTFHKVIIFFSYHLLTCVTELHPVGILCCYIFLKDFLLQLLFTVRSRLLYVLAVLATQGYSIHCYSSLTIIKNICTCFSPTGALESVSLTKGM